MKIHTIPLALLLLAACNIDRTETAELPDPDFAAVLEYTPAPGQYVNDACEAGFGGEHTPEAARAYAERRLRVRRYVSLGAWGGSLVAAFAQPVRNDGGYNLLIEGNSFATSSEPGIVWVMRDENGNGKHGTSSKAAKRRMPCAATK